MCELPPPGVPTPPANRGTAPAMLPGLFRFFFSSRRRHTRLQGDWSSDVCSSDLKGTDFAKHPTALIVNRDTTFPGSGSAVLGNPLNVVAWLANELPKFGRKLSREIGRASCRERV